MLIAEIMFALPVAIALGDQKWAEGLAILHQTFEVMVQASGGQPMNAPASRAGASFSDGDAAVAAGVDILNWAAGAGLPVRAALHRSEVLIDETGRIAGAGLVLAELMLEKARGGELIASQTVIDALERSWPGGELIGEWQFEGLPQPWSIFRLALVRNVVFEEHRSGLFAAVLPPASTLTRRELQIATLLTEGASNREISGSLEIALSTVERHISNMLLKLGFRSRAQIAAWMAEQEGGPRRR
jgi:DNA-binding CsgD family transcriptional regulator